MGNIAFQKKFSWTASKQDDTANEPERTKLLEIIKEMPIKNVKRALKVLEALQIIQEM